MEALRIRSTRPRKGWIPKEKLSVAPVQVCTLPWTVERRPSFEKSIILGSLNYPLRHENNRYYLMQIEASGMTIIALLVSRPKPGPWPVHRDKSLRKPSTTKFYKNFDKVSFGIRIFPNYQRLPCKINKHNLSSEIKVFSEYTPQHTA